MVMQLIGGAAVGLLVARWSYLWLANRRRERELERRIRLRLDVQRHLGDNE